MYQAISYNTVFLSTGWEKQRKPNLESTIYQATRESTERDMKIWRLGQTTQLTINKCEEEELTSMMATIMENWNTVNL